MANYIDFHQTRARLVGGSSRSSTSNNSSASSTRLKLHETERIEKELQLKIQQEKVQALQKTEENERMQQLEIARRAEEKRVEALTCRSATLTQPYSQYEQATSEQPSTPIPKLSVNAPSNVGLQV